MQITNAPIHAKTFVSLFLFSSVSNLCIVKGIQNGHTAMANTRNVYVRNGNQFDISAFLKDIHNSPSVNCCIENSNGIVPKSFCGFVLAFATAITPNVPSTALAPKLAVAEKHIV